MLRRYDSPTVANALDSVVSRPLNRGYTRPPLHSITPERAPMVGYAVTAEICSESPWPDKQAREHAMAGFFGAIQATAAPRVLVVMDRDGEAGSGCLWGEVNASICSALDCEGVVTDGLVRDVPAVAAMGFGYVARGVGVSHAYVRVVATGTTVTVGGAEVSPGDVIHADRHGAVVIPPGVVASVAAAADEVTRREQRLIGWVRSSAFDPGELMQRRIEH
jgi:4-hydroxy-4-methyl-2-oxoglutarate aldolase